MALKKTANFLGLSDRFTDVWVLLSETTQFLSMAGNLTPYEPQLRQWRQTLQSHRDENTIRTIKEELIQLRRHLRLQGYDVSLVRYSIQFEEFKNDACIREGFRRLVIFLTDRDLYWLAGDDNHVALAEYLERRLENLLSRQGDVRIRDRHYLWFRWEGKRLLLAGSDTESQEDYERLKKMVAANPLFFLARLRDLS
ncbi:MAG: hypothetical protein N2509_01845 [Treponemataceae bacterium]|uniref:hypothetical protein n=1 Tax=Treponema sp. J25 TaxID=2094121 RepID=UPI00104CCB21|nr:hypothetical protein [Treponema sp. J25]MCX7948837.1 hypothetical protein [Treponemataceae bacterium]HOJ99209.1 hypothetical protein [Termitinemataceae bacterium]TCW61533.1 hypothetical protein C5O22_05540 [Treponema sp. J25]HOM23917.1 hypothetical protein [Termitinemataceae bacterium]HPQ00990.1 hypothetical protein [Termitinemataceae bacterium]